MSEIIIIKLRLSLLQSSNRL